MLNYKIAVFVKENSSRFPNKNIVDFLGKPTCEHTFEYTKKYYSCFERYCITDSEYVKEISSNYCYKLYYDKYAKYHDSATYIYDEFLDYANSNIIILQCTSPVRYPRLIYDAIVEFEKCPQYTLTTVSYSTDNYYKYNGSVIIVPKNRKQHNSIGPYTHIVNHMMIPTIYSVDIDTVEDKEKAEYYMYLDGKINGR